MSHLPDCVVWLTDLLGHEAEPPPSPTTSLRGVLAHLAEVFKLPAPTALAFGEVGAQGKVSAMPEASAVLQELAAHPGCRAVLVDHELAATLRAGRHLGAVRAIGVSTLGEALVSGLGLATFARDGALWPDSVDVGWTVERLFTLALERSTVPCGWSLLEALAVGLLKKGAATTGAAVQSASEGIFRWKLAFVRDVARRHGGESSLMEWPSDEILEAFPAEVRWRVLAHVLQSASDSDLSRVDAHASAVAGVLASSPGLLSPGRAILRGALGRALAAIGRFDDASTQLRQALQEWQRLDLASSSYSLCELLRVLGIQNRRADVLALREPVQQLLAPANVSSTFVALAWGRALVQSGEPGAALETLGPPGLFEAAPSHVQTSRLRWLASAQRLTGDEAGARQSLLQLEALGESDQLYLARLDLLLDGPNAAMLVGGTTKREDAMRHLTPQPPLPEGQRGSALGPQALNEPHFSPSSPPLPFRERGLGGEVTPHALPGLLHASTSDAPISSALEACARSLLETETGCVEARNTLARLAPGLDASWAVSDLETLRKLCREYRY